MLWIREFGPRWAVSGILSERIASSSEEIESILEALDAATIRDGALSQHHRIELVAARFFSFSSGEEGDFGEGDGWGMVWQPA